VCRYSEIFVCLNALGRCQAPGLLRAGREWPRNSRTGEQRDELPPDYLTNESRFCPSAVPSQGAEKLATATRLRAGLRTAGCSYPKKWPRFSGPVFVSSLFYLILVATALLARNHAAIVALDGRGHHAAISPWANGYAARANSDGSV
jgi:hypothetical protein